MYNNSISFNRILFYYTLFLYFYALFALDRMKKFASISIDSKDTSNEIWLLSLMFVLIVALFVSNRDKLISKKTLALSGLLFLFIFTIFVNLLDSSNLSQAIYSLSLLLLPIIVLISVYQFNKEEKIILWKVIILFSLMYSLFALFLINNYGLLMNYIGNDIGAYKNYTQFRPPMMLGSSITVSYYLNLALPFSLIFISFTKERKWIVICVLASLFNILATVALLSRSASLTAVLILLVYLISSRKVKKVYKLTIISISAIGLVYMMKNFDLSRLTNGLNTDGGSFGERVNAAVVGIKIFEDNVLLGSGLAQYFPRIFENRFITYEGYSGLVDPHNTYVFILSETGIIGFSIFTIFVGVCIFTILMKENKTVKILGLLFVGAYLLSAFGGSHLINEISYSIVFYMHLGVILAYSRDDFDDL